jgi:hypothetical protein
VGGRVLVDGGVRSVTSVDLAAPAQLLVLVAPFAGPLFGMPGRLLQRSVAGELHRWRSAGGGAVLAFLPDERRLRPVRGVDDLFDPARAGEAFDAGVYQALRARLSDPPA